MNKETTKTYDVKKAIEAQSDYCKKHDLPFFAPRNGRCWCCGRQIFDEITVEVAGSRLITGCPLCHRSYVD